MLASSVSRAWSEHAEVRRDDPSCRECRVLVAPRSVAGPAQAGASRVPWPGARDTRHRRAVPAAEPLLSGTVRPGTGRLVPQRLSSHGGGFYRRSVVEGRVPTAQEMQLPIRTARLRATDGVPLDQIVRAYQIGLRLLWAHLIAMAAPQPAVCLELLERVPVTITAHSTVVMAVIEAYLEERSRILCARGQACEEFLRLLVAPEAPLGVIEGRATALRLRLDLCRSIILFRPLASERDEAAETSAERLRGSLVSAMNSESAVIGRFEKDVLPPPPLDPDSQALADLLAKVPAHEWAHRHRRRGRGGGWPAPGRIRGETSSRRRQPRPSLGAGTSLRRPCAPRRRERWLVDRRRVRRPRPRRARALRCERDVPQDTGRVPASQHAPEGRRRSARHPSAHAVLSAEADTRPLRYRPRRLRRAPARAAGAPRHRRFRRSRCFLNRRPSR